MFVSSLVILRLDGGRKGVTSSGAKLLIITAVYLFLMVTTVRMTVDVPHQGHRVSYGAFHSSM
jgi:hypothetical protein